VIQFEGIVVAEQFGQSIELGGELPVPRLVRAGGHFLGDAFELLLRSEKFIEGGLGFVEERAAGRELRVLLKHAEASAGVQRDLARIRLVLAGEDAEQRAFPGPVRPDKPDPLAGVNLERHAFKERRGVVTARLCRPELLSSRLRRE